jgi:hypothetical protein
VTSNAGKPGIIDDKRLEMLTMELQTGEDAGSNSIGVDPV